MTLLFVILMAVVFGAILGELWVIDRVGKRMTQMFDGEWTTTHEERERVDQAVRPLVGKR